MKRSRVVSEAFGNYTQDRTLDANDVTGLVDEDESLFEKKQGT